MHNPARDGDLDGFREVETLEQGEAVLCVLSRRSRVDFAKGARDPSELLARRKNFYVEGICSLVGGLCLAHCYFQQDWGEEHQL